MVVILLGTVFVRSGQVSKCGADYDKQYNVEVHVHDDDHNDYVEKCVKDVNQTRH